MALVETWDYINLKLALVLLLLKVCLSCPHSCSGRHEVERRFGQMQVVMTRPALAEANPRVVNAAGHLSTLSTMRVQHAAVLTTPTLPHSSSVAPAHLSIERVIGNQVNLLPHHHGPRAHYRRPAYSDAVSRPSGKVQETPCAYRAVAARMGLV